MLSTVLGPQGKFKSTGRIALRRGMKICTVNAHESRSLASVSSSSGVAGSLYVKSWAMNSPAASASILSPGFTRVAGAIPPVAIH